MTTQGCYRPPRRSARHVSARACPSSGAEADASETARVLSGVVRNVATALRESSRLAMGGVKAIAPASGSVWGVAIKTLKVFSSLKDASDNPHRSPERVAR